MVNTTKWMVMFIFIWPSILLTGCRVNTIEPEQVRNLTKLSKVWGFAKYTHQSFLTGLKCWDEELLSLIPLVRFAGEDEVNDILYEWFLNLGEDGYDLNLPAIQSALSDRHLAQSVDFFEDESSWEHVHELFRELWLLERGSEKKLRPTANLSWINEDYLGIYLADALLRFNKIQLKNNEVSPFYFNEIGNSAFTNKENYVNMDFSNDGYRLLGLFRLWNAINYFFPYLDIIDYNWNELLFKYIPKMLEGRDRFSYEVTLVKLASKLQDAHVILFNEQGQVLSREIFNTIFGSYFAPVKLLEAEGYLVVGVENIPELRRGDIVLKVNNRCINEITTEMLKYLPYPNSENALAFLVRDNGVIRQHNNRDSMVLEILRNEERLRIYVNRFYKEHMIHMSIFDSYIILEENIGLINPSTIMPHRLYRNMVLRNIMTEFKNANTNGLIIDLRQGTNNIHFLLAEYLVVEPMHFVTMSQLFLPGVFIDSFRGYAGYGQLEYIVRSLRDIGYGTYLIGAAESFGSFFHNQNVAILMDENSQSHIEFTIMALSTGSNVTIIGTNSIGANGNVVPLPLPGGITMLFTGLGVYTPEGGQTQRIGLSPDIYVPRTIAGIRDGVDEVMEAAVRFLVSQRVAG